MTKTCYQIQQYFLGSLAGFYTLLLQDQACLTQFKDLVNGSTQTSSLAVAYQILQYVKNTFGHGLLFLANNSLSIKAFANSDWASCHDSRRSTSRYCIFFGDYLVTKKTKKQQTVFQSSTEAKYRSMTSTTCEIFWLLTFLSDFHTSHTHSAELFYDGQ